MFPFDRLTSTASALLREWLIAGNAYIECVLTCQTFSLALLLVPEMVLTLAASRPILWSYVMSVPFETATDDQINQFDSVLNRLCERLLIEGKWRSTFRRVTLRTYLNTLTLPRNLDNCLGADPVTSSWSSYGFPLNIYSRWNEFAASGPGFVRECADACSIRGLSRISDNAQTFADPVGTFYLRAISTRASGSGFTLIGGLDQNDAQITRNVRLRIANGTTTTTQQYTEMPFIEKSMTNAPVSLYSVDTTTAVETLLCVYAASETIPAYSRYVIPSAEDGSTFACLCKLAFVPAILDTDIIIPSITDALILGLMSFQFRDRNDAERSALYMGPNYPGTGDSTVKGVMKGAVDVLDMDRSELEFAEQQPFNVSPNFGAGNILSVR